MRSSRQRVFRLLLFAAAVFLPAATALADSWTNLARGQTVTGSYMADHLQEFGWIWENAVDGDRNGDPIALRGENGAAWVQIDFGAKTRMNKVILIPFAQCYPIDFRIEVLTDDGWQQAARLTGQKEPGFTQDAAGSTFKGQVIAFDTLEGTALRLTATRLAPDTNGDGYMQLREIEVYDDGGPADRTAPPAPGEADKPVWLYAVLGGAGVLALGGAGICLFIMQRRKYKE